MCKKNFSHSSRALLTSMCVCVCVCVSAREEWDKFFLRMNDRYCYEACIFIAYGHLQKSLVHGGDGSNHTLLQIPRW